MHHLAAQDCPLAPYQQLFRVDGVSKAARQQLPPLATVLTLMATVRQKVLDYLIIAPIQQQLRVWLWLLQHESQHAETMAIVLALHRQRCRNPLATPVSTVCSANSPTMVWLPGITFDLGYPGIEALDNEQPHHSVTVEGFWLDPYPVTQAAFHSFIAAGGYHTPSFWSPEGWAWRQATGVTQPLYWSNPTALGQRPVCGVSFYEAEAYATFVGKRLPTELEWERAACWSQTGHYRGPYPWGATWPQPRLANCDGHRGATSSVDQYPEGATDNGLGDLLGNVWEWTSSWFEGYPGFAAFPYDGYSQLYFDRQHRVLRGGSWATRPWALRATLRNWYQPQVREIFAGFRCAKTETGKQSQ